MDRELLIEIGTEELPASWLPSLTRQLGEHVAARLKALRLPPDAPSETFSTPRRLTVRVARIAERQSDLEEVVNGPAVSAAFKPDGSPTPAAVGFARKNGVEVNALERVETPKGTYLAFRRHVRGKAAVDVLPDVLTGVLRDMAFPETDALGCLARGLARRTSVRPADPVDPVPVRRPRRPVHHPPQRGRAVRAGAGSPVGRGDLRPSLSRDQRPRGAGHQGSKLRRVPRQADGELRHPRSGRAARQDRPRARRPRAAPGRSREHRRCDAVRPAAGSARPGRVPGGRRRDVHPGFPDAARRSADDDDDSPSALLPGGQRRRQADARVPGGDEHAAGQRAPHLAAISSASSRRGCGTRDSSSTPTAGTRSRRACPRLRTLLYHKKLGSYHAKAARLERLARWMAAEAYRAPEAAEAAATAGRLAKVDLDHRHGSRADGAAGHDGRHLRPRRGPARADLARHLSPVPARRRRGGRALRHAGSWAPRRSPGRPLPPPTRSTPSLRCSPLASGRPARAIRSACAARRTGSSRSSWTCPS